jgi:hypothetical protein
MADFGPSIGRAEAAELPLVTACQATAKVEKNQEETDADHGLREI